MNAVDTKKALLGIIATDGYIDARNRLDLYSKYPEFIEHIAEITKGITNLRISAKPKYDKRFGVTGYRLWSNSHAYLKKMRDIFYPLGEKKLSPYVVNRLNVVSFAYMWMCDGYLTVGKNRKTNTGQNIGYLCLEAFEKEEVELLKCRFEFFGIFPTLQKVKWGKGFRLRFGGENLQRLISAIYPHILPCFIYKTYLFYKGKDYILDLPNAEQYVKFYSCVEDIVRHPQK